MRDDSELWPTSSQGQSAVGQSESPLLRREGEYWTIVFDEQLIRLRDRKGLQYLAMLLRQPGEQISATQLSRVVDGHEAAGSQGRAAAEAARVRVTRAVVAAVQQIRRHHESLGMHLLTTLRTGSACVYTPDSRVPIRWKVE